MSQMQSCVKCGTMTNTLFRGGKCYSCHEADKKQQEQIRQGKKDKLLSEEYNVGGNFDK